MPLIVLPDNDREVQEEVELNVCDSVMMNLVLFIRKRKNRFIFKKFDPNSQDKNDFYKYVETTDLEAIKDNGIRSYKIRPNKNVGRFLIICLQGDRLFEGCNSYQEIADYLNIMFNKRLIFDSSTAEDLCRELDINIH